MQDLDDITGAIDLKVSNIQVGLLINFGAPTLRDGLRRVVNGFVPSATSRLRVNQASSETDQKT